MGLRKEVPHAKCSPLCAIKEKLQELWDRAYGCINKINDITPDGDGKFTIQAGTNIQLTEISNGLKIDTTGGISYYSPGDTYIDVDNSTLEISLVNPGQTGGVALHDDLDVVAQAVVDIVNGTTQVGDAAHADAADTATYIGSSSNNVGSDTKPIKVVNGVATAVTNDLIYESSSTKQPTYGALNLSDGAIFNWAIIQQDIASGGGNYTVPLPIHYNTSAYQVIVSLEGLPGGIDALVFSARSLDSDNAIIEWYNTGAATIMGVKFRIFTFGVNV